MVTLAGVAQLATGYTANKYIAEFHGVDRDRTARIIGFCTIVSVFTATIGLLAMIGGASWLAVHGLDKPQLRWSLVAASGMVFFFVLNGFQLGVLAGLESFRQIARGIALGAVGMTSACLTGAWLGGARGAAACLSVGAMLQWLAVRQALKSELAARDITPVYHELAQEKRIFLHFALPAALTGFISTPAIWIANSFLIRQPNGVEEMALFAAANSLRSLVLFLPQLLNRVTTTLLNSERGRGDRAQYREVFRVNLASSALIALAACAGVAVLGPWLLKAFGKSFGGAYPVLLLLLLAAIAEVAFQAVYQLVQSNEKMWHSLLVVVVPRDGSIAVLAFFLAPRFGVTGLAESYAIAWCLGLVFVSALARHTRLLPNPT
jgi:O-antigen/teichoic acid export membrane protein